MRKKPQLSQQERIRWNRRVKAIERRRVKRLRKGRAAVRRQTNDYLALPTWVRERKTFTKGYYKRLRYDGEAAKIIVQNEIGLESNLAGYLDLGEKIIDLESRTLTLDMKNCEFIWPSAVTLFCSLAHWLLLTGSVGRSAPRVASTPSSSDAVNSYLAHCGFYDFVQRAKDNVQVSFDDDQVVKIIREPSAKNLQPRIRNIKQLLKTYSAWTPEQIESFGDSVLPEVFLNVTEHGMNYQDAGWYTLAQVRQHTGVITLCIGDNGIGIKNSLLTGPQRDVLLRKFSRDGVNDGDVIFEAMKENISGASGASLKSGRFRKKYERGRRRGLGLTRIRDCCENLNVPFTIVSGKGAIQIASGKAQPFSRKHRVFAGTLYHFLIPAIKVQ